MHMAIVEFLDKGIVYEGARDEEGIPNGRGTLKLIEAGVRFEGRFYSGEKYGRGCFYFPDGSSLAGVFKSDALEGRGVYNYADGRCMVAEYKDGELNGPFTEYDEGGNVLARGFHEENRRVDHLQVFDEYGGLIWGEVDQDERLTGNGIAYIYPDHKHALVGSFVDGVLKKAKWGFLKNSINDGQPEIVLDYKNTEMLEHDESTCNCISRFPLVPDLYEQERVYVAMSGIPSAGEGLFARVNLPEGEVVSFYNGVRIAHEEVDERDWSENEYTIALCDEVVLDVPKEFSSLKKYCATLGHKANHSNMPNCEYALYDHPRFGKIKCIKTICSVKKDQELTCDYAYDHKNLLTGQDDLPYWFNSKRIVRTE